MQWNRNCLLYCESHSVNHMFTYLFGGISMNEAYQKNDSLVVNPNKKNLLSECTKMIGQSERVKTKQANNNLRKIAHWETVVGTIENWDTHTQKILYIRLIIHELKLLIQLLTEGN